MRLLKLPEVLKKVPVGKTTWYAMINSGEAPEPFKLGARSVAWSEEQIDAWIRQRQPDAKNMTALQS